MSICINLIYTRLYPIVYPHILLVLHPIWRVALVLEARLFLKGKRHQRHLIANERATLICLQLKVRWETVWKCGLWHYDHPKMLENGKWINQMTIQKCWNMGNESTRWPSKNVGKWEIHSPITLFCGDKLPGFQNFFPARRRCKFTWQPPYMSSKMPLQQGRRGDFCQPKVGIGWPTVDPYFPSVDWPLTDRFRWLVDCSEIPKLLGHVIEDGGSSFGYGSIPINTVFRGMNIHLPAILMFTRGTRFWHTAISAMFGISKAALVFSRNGCCWDCKAGLSRFQETTLALQEPPFCVAN